MSEAPETTNNPFDLLVQAKNLTEFRQGLESLKVKDVPLLTEMAEFSLILMKKESPRETKARAGAAFLKKALEIAIEKKERSNEEVLEYLRDVSSYFGFIVAAPFVVTSENYDNIYLRHYIDINAAGKNSHEVVSEKRRKDYAEFEGKVRTGTERYMRGLLGELMVFCCCQKAGLNPEAAFFKTDIRGADLFIHLNKTKIPLQVKCKKPIYGLESQEPTSKVLINPIIPPFYRNDGEINIGGLKAMLTNRKAMTNLLHEIGIALRDWAEMHNQQIDIPSSLMVKSQSTAYV